MGINIQGIDKAKLLQELYNNSKPQGMGYFASGSALGLTNQLTYEQAQKILASGMTSFDYLYGRVMKVDLAGATLDPRSYDRDLGQGAALKVVQKIVSENAPSNSRTIAIVAVSVVAAGVGLWACKKAYDYLTAETVEEQQEDDIVPPSLRALA